MSQASQPEPGDRPSAAQQPPGGNSHRALWDAISALLNSDSWDAARMVVNDNPALTGREAERMLGQLVAQMHLEGNTQVAEYVDLHRRVLALAREIGVDEAFYRLQNAEPLSAGLSDDEVLDVVVHNTLAVLTVAPGELPGWRSTVTTLWSQAEEAGDADLANLLVGISALLEGEAVERLDLALSGATRHAWERLLSELAPPQDPFSRMCDTITATTLAALGAMPLMRPHWRAACQALARSAGDLGDDELAALALAIVALIDGEDPDAAAPAATREAYRACWAAIRKGLGQPGA